MPAFGFDDSKTFDENWITFIEELKSVDADMAGILAANKNKLSAIVRQGTRSTGARSAFNADVVKALDALVAKSASSKATS